MVQKYSWTWQENPKDELALTLIQNKIVCSFMNLLLLQTDLLYVILICPISYSDLFSWNRHVDEFQ
jgi:hypothetical protein